MNIEQINSIKGQVIKVVRLRMPYLSDSDWDDVWQETLTDIWQHPGEWQYPYLLARVFSRAVNWVIVEQRRGFTNVPEKPEIVPLEEYLLPNSPLNTEHDVWVQELRNLCNKIPAP